MMTPVEKSIFSYLRDYAEAQPNDLFLHGEEGGYTVKELYYASLSAAKALSERGVARGQHIGLAGTRTIEAIILFLALQYLGAVTVLCDPHTDARTCIEQSGVPLIPDHTIDYTSGGWLVDGKPFRILKADDAGLVDAEKPDVYAPAVIIFTSGSTGKNKGVIHSQYSLVNHQRNFHVVGGNEPGDSAIQMLPIFHIFGLTQILDGIMHRCPLFFPKEVTPEGVCAGVEKYGFTRFGFVPSFALGMANAKKEKCYNTDTLKIAVLAGAPSTREQFNFIQDTLGMKIVPCYGMSECPGISGGAPTESDEDRASSVGKILPLTEVQIEDDGEICVRAPSLCIGYVGEKPLDRNAFFPTGDLGYLDDKGFLHITGRKKDIIIRNGNNLSAAALENKLLALPFVESAAVVGLNDAKCGEVPAAAITLKRGCAYDEKQLRAAFNALEMPTAVRVLEKMPLNAAGKINKQKVKELFA